MRIGVCANITSLRDVKDAGFDHIEMPAVVIASLDKEKCRQLKEEIMALEITAKEYSNFLPGNLKVTGPDVDLKALREYMETVIEKVAFLGGELIVFGSGGSRKCEEGWPHERAFCQFVEAADIAGKIGKEHGVVIALEHLNKKETNIANSLEETLKVAKDICNPNVQIIVDFYHMRAENEEMSVIEKLNGYIAHVHMASGVGRFFPKSSDEDCYKEFFDLLKSVGYDGGISLEGNYTDFKAESTHSIQLLKSLWG